MAEIYSSSKKTNTKQSGNVIPFVFTKQRNRSMPVSKDQDLYLQAAREVLRLVNEGNLKYLSVVVVHAQKGMINFEVDPNPNRLVSD